MFVLYSTIDGTIHEWDHNEERLQRELERRVETGRNGLTAEDYAVRDVMRLRVDVSDEDWEYGVVCGGRQTRWDIGGEFIESYRKDGVGIIRRRRAGEWETVE